MKHSFWLTKILILNERTKVSILEVLLCSSEANMTVNVQSAVFS